MRFIRIRLRYVWKTFEILDIIIKKRQGGQNL
ncbi:hypothetical protein ALO_06563 [Acetonema longum DSM 6540]|uniref:Uncharacterized protein n=1 Tax=Acetonema longum DSM 6540 TaxID=1009370 RepID=F7NGX1_9FIRM|nr:hypothetical protein ALO_06563 [Acetonema longum DSM 6540]